jgi:hypothetical protein
MPRIRKAQGVGWLVLLIGGGLFAQEPAELLGKHGLTKSGAYFVVASEEPVLQMLYNLRPYMGEMEGRFMQWAGILQNEFEHQQLSEYVIRLDGQLSALNAQIRSMQERNALQRQEKAEWVQYRNMVDQERRWANQERAIRQNRLVGPRVKEKAESDFKERREKFVAAKGQTWPAVEKTVKEYEDIKQNESVLNALKAFNQESKAHFRLGPSDKLTKAAQQVIKYEREYSPETATKPKKMPRRRGLELTKKRRS